MATPVTTSKNTSDTGAESPTTARPLDLDDDDVQETGILNVTGGAEDGTSVNTRTETTTSATNTTNPTANTTSRDEAAPPKPPRPMTEAQKNALTLKEAFPTVDDTVIKAVLSASGGQVEPAFNALLEMTDPEAVKSDPPDEVPPPQPPRPRGQQQPMSQLEADERYARQLAEHYDNVGNYEQRTSSRQQPSARSRQATGQDWGDEDREHSFLDDDLPVIRENLRKGFVDTQTKVNGWIKTFQKKLDETFDESESSTNNQPELYRRGTGSGRPSGDYDADPQVLSDDFSRMRFGGEPVSVNRNLSQKGAFPPRSTSSPRPSDGRRVVFKEETEEINMYDHSPKVPAKDTPPVSSIKASKWQPLSAAVPSPITDNDPFSLGDSEDERDAKDKPKDGKETKDAGDATKEDNDRLKQAAAEAMADSLVDTSKTSEPALK